MVVRKNITLKGIMEFAGHHFVWLITYIVYYFIHLPGCGMEMDCGTMAAGFADWYGGGFLCGV